MNEVILVINWFERKNAVSQKNKINHVFFDHTTSESLMMKQYNQETKIFLPDNHKIVLVFPLFEIGAIAFVVA